MFTKKNAIVAATILGLLPMASAPTAFSAPLVSQIIPPSVFVPPHAPPAEAVPAPAPGTKAEPEENAVEASILLRLAGGAEAEGNLLEALRLYEKVIQLTAKAGVPSVNAAIANGRLGALCADLDSPEIGIRFAKRSLQEFEQLEGPVNNDVAIELNNLAWLQEQAGKNLEAERSYEQALTILQIVAEDNEDLFAITENNLADLLTDQHRVKEAYKHYQNSYEHAKASFGQDNPLTKMIQKKLWHAAHLVHPASTHRNKSRAVKPTHNK